MNKFHINIKETVKNYCLALSILSLLFSTQEIKPTNISYVAGCAGQFLILPVSGYSLFKLYQVDPKAGVAGTITLSSFLIAAGAKVWDSFSAGSRQNNAATTRHKGLSGTHDALIKNGFWISGISGLATLYFLYKKMHAK